jgi:hypothetical protein
MKSNRNQQLVSGFVVPAFFAGVLSVKGIVIMCDCEDRPCCGCLAESNFFGGYEADPIDAYRESLEMDWDEEDEDEEDPSGYVHHEDVDFLTD